MKTLFELAAEELLNVIKKELKLIERTSAHNGFYHHAEISDLLLKFQGDLRKLKLDHRFLYMFPETHSTTIYNTLELCKYIHNCRLLIQTPKQKAKWCGWFHNI